VGLVVVEGHKWRGVGGRDWVLGLLGYGCVTWSIDCTNY
jgi:hypothetical protein